MKKQKRADSNGSSKKSYFTFFVLIVILVLFFSVAYSNSKQVTGRISLDSMGIVYNEGEPIGGLLEFYLYGGELIPADSLVVVKIDGQTKEFLLSSLLSLDSTLGEFYAQGTKVHGSGEGYGVLGERIVNPEVEFDLIVHSSGISEAADAGPDADASDDADSDSAADSDSDSGSGGSSDSADADNNDAAPPKEEDNGAGDPPSVPDVPEETPPEPDGENPLPDASVPSEPESPELVPPVSTPITGALTSESDFIVSGKAAKGEDFVYDYEGAEGAEIVSGSAKVNGESIGDSFLSVGIMKDEVVVSTDYSYTENGFGENFLTDSKSLVAQIDLAEFGLIAEKNVNSVSIYLYYDGEILTETEKKFYVINASEKDKLNESETNITIEPNITVERVQSGAVLGRPVKWTQKIDLREKEAGKVVINLPEYAENVEVSKVVKVGRDISGSTADKVIVSANDDGDSVEIIENEVENTESDEATGESGFGLTGEVTARVRLDKEDNGFLISLVSWVKNVFGKPTGLVVSDPTGLAISDKIVDNNIVEITDDTGREVVQEVTLEYETPAPYAIENTFANRKEVVIVGPDTVHYTDVISFTEVPESFGIVNPGIIKVFWQDNGIYMETTEVSDLDGNGVYDYVEWITPSLSNQTFIIEIIRAEHLNENRTLLSDIYEEVRSLDDVWSETIPESHYVRVTFEKNLTSSNDITVYPRTLSGTPRIDIYEADGNETIAEFASLEDNRYNKVFLQGLQGEQDTFDLHILGGSVEFNHIIDPADEAPTIDFASPTPADLETVTTNSFYVNVSSSDDLTDHYTFTDFDSDLVLWIRMDDINASGDAIDLSTYSNNATKQGNAAQASAGYFGSRFVFDGTGDYIAVGNKDSVSGFKINTPFTVSVWINSSDVVSNRQVVSDTTAGSVGWGIYQDSSGSVKFEIGDGTTTAACAPEEAISAGNWYFFYGRYNGSAVSCGLNGQDIPEIAYTGTTFLNAAGVSIGSINSASAVRSWDGSIDEVLIFNRSLANAELDSIFNATSSKYGNNFTGLADGSYTIKAYAVDTTGNKNETAQRTITVDTASSVINVNSCTTLSTANKIYNLTRNIVVGQFQASPCININAQNVTFVGNGFQIGRSGFANSIVYSNQNFTSIRNVVLNRSAGLSQTGEITLVNASNSNVTGVTFGPGNIGLVLQNVHNSHFDGNTFATTDRGVNTITYSGNNTFNYNSVTGTNYSLVLTGGNNTVLNTNLSNPDINALYITGSNNYFSNVKISNSMQSAIVLVSGGNNTLYSVDLNNTNVSFYDIDFSASNRTHIVNTKPGRYSFTGIGGIVRIFDSRKGEIQYLNEINGSGENFTNEVYIDINLASVKSELNLGLNRSANVTFFNMPGNFTEPFVFRAGRVCPSETCPNYTGLNEASVKFKAPDFSNYSIGDLPMCLNIGTCAEGDNCVIDRDCRLNSTFCTDAICDFVNFTLSATLYTGYTGLNANNLDLNISGKVLFLLGNRVEFSGKNDPSEAGHGGILNITMPPTGLFNRTDSIFNASGGNSVPGGGGNGGTIQLNYHGLLGATGSWTANVAGGSGTTQNGGDGSVIYNKYLAPCPRDADVDNSGVVGAGDIPLIRNRYGNVSTDSTFDEAYDINCDGQLNIKEIARIGFEFGRGDSD